MALVDLTSVTTGSIGTNTNFIVEENKVLKRISQSSLLKTSAISTTQVNSTTNVPSSSLVYSMNQSITTLNSEVTNKTTLVLDYCTNLLDYAESATEGFCYVVRLAGTGYTGNNLPTNGNYKYGSAIIMKRYANSMTILLFGSSYNEQIMINTWNINTNSWGGWYSVQENCMKTHQMDSFDFDNPTYTAGSYRLGSNNQNSPGDSLNYGNVFIARNNTSNTLAMLAFPFSNDGKIYYRQGNTEGWATAPWYYLQGIKIE